MKWAGSLLLVVVFACCVLAAELATANDVLHKNPNIVVIVGDDHGWPYYGFMGDDIVSTPNLDRLAAEGTMFRNAFSSESSCRPALQTLLTGLHGRSWIAQRDRIELDLGHELPFRTEVPHYVTLPRQLARQGYQSFQGGKHWEGNFVDAGFDSGTALLLHPDALRSVGDRTFGRVHLNPLPAFLDAVGDQPFFLMLAPNLPHAPHNAAPALRAPFEALGLAPQAVAYYANITWFDNVVGLMLGELESRGLLENSLIIYISDNGWEQAPYQEHFLGRYLGGSKGKLSIHELGYRTPLIFSRPGHVQENRVLDDLVTFEDVHATILEYAGAPMPPDHEGFGLRGRIEGSDTPSRQHVIGVQDLLRVRESEFEPPVSLASVVRYESGAFLRTARWRYVEYLDRGERALYRIDQDPFEESDVAAEHPQKLERFAARTAQWRDELAAPAPWMDLMGRLDAEDGTIGSGLRLRIEGRNVAGTDVRMQVFSDTRGYFRFPNVSAGTYELRHETNGAATNWRKEQLPTESRTIDLTDYETAPFLTLDVSNGQPQADPSAGEPGAIELELFDHRGEAVSGVPLEVWGWTVSGRRQLRVSSGPDGFAVLDQLPAGFYVVSARPDQPYRRTSRWVYLAPGAIRSVELQIREPRWRGKRWRASRGWSHSRTRR
ncbi:MAG: sulfatase-like hydrolase/transferase [Deltaproteobacteria bacterium]|nr:sulfatase-like hydrolase/transferase [Deltaproteobacteria bacterium]